MNILVKNAYAEIPSGTIGFQGPICFEFKDSGLMRVAGAELKCSVQQFAQAVQYAVEERAGGKGSVRDYDKERIRDKLLEILEHAKSSTSAATADREFTVFMPEDVSRCTIDVTKSGLSAAAGHAARRGEVFRKMKVLGLIS
jgi:hypothetical protein